MLGAQEKKMNQMSPSKELEDGDMPMPIYLLNHPEARLTDKEIDSFIKGLKATFGESKEDEEENKE